MKTKLKILVVALALIAAILAAVWYLRAHPAVVLNPKGPVGESQKDLLVFAFVLSLFVILPVFALTFFIVWRYREGHKRDYQPEWAHSRKLETIWWGIPIFIILILSIVTWRTSHQLDPFKPLASAVSPLRIQVIALDWKWLFIYPEQGVAMINEIHIPVGTPINFEITADAPMNSFWIPQLGGQIYAMTGMTSELHLQADRMGTYRGSSANISGEGFAEMYFDVQAVNPAKFENWITSLKTSSSYLDETTYSELVKPSRDNQVAYYSGVKPGLFRDIVGKYMYHDNTPHNAAEGHN